MGLEWSKEKPTVPGMYLRANPPISFVCRQDVADVDGKLKVPRTDGGVGLVPLEKIPKSFLWFGPIPKPQDVFPECWAKVGGAV